ncbi:MAG: hypothetical protein HZC45_09265, partial [Deltaproteobacteria bacterium]|nr:hypothetical protein [Deltaproteobacteria bacterium]
IIDRDHRIEWMNNKAVEWLGNLKIGERRKCYRTIAYSTSFCNVCPTGKTLDSGIPTHYEFHLPTDIFLESPKNRTKNKKPTDFEVIGIPVFDEYGNVLRVLELILDATEKSIKRIRSEELMAQIEKMAAVGQLAAGVAHELNTPLATIYIISQELRCIMDGMAKGKIKKEEMNDYLEDIDGEIKRCQIIINDLLSFSKKVEPEWMETDLNKVLINVVHLIQKGEIYKNVYIVKKLDKSLPVINTDPERFKQVAFNIIKNAAEAVMDRKDGNVLVSTKRDGCFIKVIVSDNGDGISRENLKKIFEPFFTTKPVGKGTGLGLSVSYGIIKNLKGDIKIESEVGVGTNVSISLPIE